MGRPIRLIIAAIMAIFALVSYFGMEQDNPVTGEKQRISLSPKEEIALGLEAAPQMAQQMGGLHPDKEVQQYVNELGNTIVNKSDAKKGPYQYAFYVLDDSKTVNAFALPGGQIFITAALLKKLDNEAQLAGVLGHEIGHVVARHTAEHIAKGNLTQVLAGAAGVAVSDPGQYGSTQRATMIASMVGQLITLRYGRQDELESDGLGLQYMASAGYDPAALIGVMEILEQTSGRGKGPEWLQSHPNPGNRRQTIQKKIDDLFPQGHSRPLSLTGNQETFEAIQQKL